MLRDIDSPPTRAHAGEERRQHRSAEHDADGVDVLNPLRLNLHGTDHQIHVVDREQHQAARRHLVEGPEHQRANGQNQVGRHVPPLAAILVADREINERERDYAADRLDDRLGPSGPLEHEPHDGDETDENGDARELAQPELFRRRIEQRRIAVDQRLPVEYGEDDGAEVAERRKDEEARVTLGRLEIPGSAEPDEEADVHAGVVPEEGSFAARVLRCEALREHHVNAGNVETAAGKEKSQADVQHREGAGRDAPAADHLQSHAPDEEIAVRKEAATEVTAEEVQAVVEGAEHTHQHGGRFHAELQMLRRVEYQRRVEDGEAERREDLNEEQRGRSLRCRGEKALERFDELRRRANLALRVTFNVIYPAAPARIRVHPALLCRSTRRVMSSGSQARTLRREAASLFASRSREADDSVLAKTERACDVSRVVMRLWRGCCSVTQ